MRCCGAEGLQNCSEKEVQNVRSISNDGLTNDEKTGLDKVTGCAASFTREMMMMEVWQSRQTDRRLHCQQSRATPCTAPRDVDPGRLHQSLALYSRGNTSSFKGLLYNKAYNVRLEFGIGVTRVRPYHPIS